MADATNSDKTGMVAYNGTGTFNGRTITAGTGISVANGDGVSANPTISAGATIATTYTEDSGSATPSLNNLNILGGTGITTSGAGSTVTIDADASVPTTFTEDSGSATPAANNLNILGTGGIVTSGSGSTVTIDGSGVGGGLWTLLDTKSGAASFYDFTTSLDDTYQAYAIFWDIVISANTTAIVIQVSNDGGGSFISTASYWSGLASTSIGAVIGNGGSAASNDYGWAWVYNVGTSTNVVVSGFGRKGGGNKSTSCEAITSVNALRLRPLGSSPTISSGSARLYGVG